MAKQPLFAFGVTIGVTVWGYNFANLGLQNRIFRGWRVDEQKGGFLTSSKPNNTENKMSCFAEFRRNILTISALHEKSGKNSQNALFRLTGKGVGYASF